MVRHRFVGLLPVLSVVITSALWLSARAQYRAFLCPPPAACPANGSPIGWSDYTPPSIQAAGMLNIPVAIFARPLYGLVQSDVRKWELFALLLGVVALWSYIGWRVDTGNTAPHPRTALRIFAVILGCIFSFLVLFEAITMFHAGFLYRFVAICWSLLMVRHFILLLRVPAAPQTERLYSGWHLPRITLGSISMCWAAFVVIGALALSPRDSFGRPNAALAHVFAVCGAVLLLATAYAVCVYLVAVWRKMATAPNRPCYVVWAGFDTFLVMVAVAVMIFVAVRG